MTNNKYHIINKFKKTNNNQYHILYYWKRGFHRFKRNPLSLIGLIIILILSFMAIFADHISPFPEDSKGAVNFKKRFQPPSSEHLFGTDEAGRDVLSRTIYGARISLFTSILIQILVTIIGVFLGMTAGYFGGLVGSIIMRTSDVFISIPPLILAMIATTEFKPSLGIGMIAVCLAWWPWKTRLIYSLVLKIKEEQFIEASHIIGKNPLRIIFQDILPNLTSVIFVKSTLDMAFVILSTSSLSFLGLGAQPPIPEWGTIISSGRKYLPDYWWVSTFPGIFIFLAVLGFCLVGDGLRDLFDVEVEQ